MSVLITAGFVAALISLTVQSGSDGPPHPEAWDPRVADIAAFVETERGLSFENPVFVDFLTAEQYRAEAIADEPAADDEAEALEQEATDQYVGSLRAMGLLEGAPDMDQASDELSDGGTLAFYAPETERITVRGTEMTPGLRVTLAHELTHALQDQQFDMERMYELPEIQGEVLRAVAEGDAQRVESVYVDEELTDEELVAYEAESQTASDEGEAALAETVPDILVASFASRYILGAAFVELVYQLEGNAGIDRALKTPPANDIALFDPFRFFSPSDPHPVDPPTPDEGADVIDEGEFGATNLYMLLASRIDAGDALAAVDGWAGDAMVTSATEDEVCVQVSVVGTIPDATRRLGSALAAWSAAMPGDRDTVDVGDGEAPVQLTMCDPGGDAALAVTPDITRVLNLPVFRTYLAAETIEYRGFGEAEADCVGDDVVERVDLDKLDDPESLYADPDFSTALEGVLIVCDL